MSRIETMAPRSRARADLDRHVGSRLRSLRKERGLAIWRLAAAAEIDIDSLMDFEAGRHRMPAALLGRLARLMDTDVRAFFEGYEV